MTITRKYLEQILNCIDSIAESEESGVLKYFETKSELLKTLNHIQRFHLLNLELDKSFYQNLENQLEKKIPGERIEILVELITALINVSVERDPFKIFEPDYFKGIEVSLTKLSFKEYQKVQNNLQKNISDSYLVNLHKQRFKNYLNLKSEKDFIEYKDSLKKEKSPIRYRGKLETISKGELTKIHKFFETKIGEYRRFVFENYPSIKDQFTYYNSFIRVYFINRRDKGASMRIFVYKKPLDDSIIYIHPKVLDFTPYESENIEETEQKMIGGLYTYVRFDEDFKLKGRRSYLFTEFSIYSELIRFFLQNAKKNQLQELAQFLFKCQGYVIQNFEKAKDNDYDLILRKGKSQYFVQFATDEMKNISNLKKRLGENKNTPLMLVTTYPMNEETVEYAKMSKTELTSIGGMCYDHLNNDNGVLIHWYIKSVIDDIKIKKSEASVQSTLLIERLEKCPKGKSGWVEYENIGCEIIEYLFAEDFRKYTAKSQSHTHEGTLRRDLIINNNFKSGSSFWADVKTEFNANIIIVDFKNYSDKLEQNELYIPTKYLSSSAGNVAILLTRKGISENAKTLQKKMFSSDNKLVLILDDTDLIQMLREKAIGNDVSYVLDNKKFLLYESI